MGVLLFLSAPNTRGPREFSTQSAFLPYHIPLSQPPPPTGTPWEAISHAGQGSSRQSSDLHSPSSPPNPTPQPHLQLFSRRPSATPLPLSLDYQETMRILVRDTAFLPPVHTHIPYSSNPPSSLAQLLIPRNMFYVDPQWPHLEDPQKHSLPGNPQPSNFSKILKDKDEMRKETPTQQRQDHL